VTDLDSGAEFDSDLTLEAFKDFIEGFCFANFQGVQATVSPTAATTSAFTVPAMDAAISENHLVFSRGFTNSENNGLMLVDAAGTTTSIPVTNTMVAETPAETQNAIVDIAGYRFPIGDLEVNSDGDLITTTTDLSSLGLVAGQSIWIGGEETVNQFDTAADVGFARILTISTNLLTLDKRSQDYTADTGTDKLIDLYFGQFVKNVAVDNSEYLERSFQFEGAYADLGGVGVPEYEYSKGNYCNTVGFDLPLTDKATMTVAFVGTDTDSPTTTRATNADAPLEPVQTGAFNTSADIARLRIQDVDETGLTTDFKSITLNINNNVSPEKVLGQLGAKYLNTGNFEIDIEAQLLFTNSDVVAAVRENRTVTMDFSIDNDDGAFLVDIPSMTLGGGDREYPVNESILINSTGMAYGDTTFGNSIGISMFPFKPDI
jgi:hypothetical protein